MKEQYFRLVEKELKTRYGRYWGLYNYNLTRKASKIYSIAGDVAIDKSSTIRNRDITEKVDYIKFNILTGETLSKLDYKSLAENPIKAYTIARLDNFIRENNEAVDIVVGLSNSGKEIIETLTPTDIINKYINGEIDLDTLNELVKQYKATAQERQYRSYQ